MPVMAQRKHLHYEMIFKYSGVIVCQQERVCPAGTPSNLSPVFLVFDKNLGPHKQHSFLALQASWALRRSCGSATLTHCFNGKICVKKQFLVRYPVAWSAHEGMKNRGPILVFDCGDGRTKVEGSALAR